MKTNLMQCQYAPKGTRLTSIVRRQSLCMSKRDEALTFPSHITSQKTSCNLDSQSSSKTDHIAVKHSEYFSFLLGGGCRESKMFEDFITAVEQITRQLKL